MATRFAHVPDPSPVTTDVAIVGGGIAGLYAGYRLKLANLPFVILEADGRWGGRVKSRPEQRSKLGLTLDEGANLINSTDRLAIGLMNRFGIAYVRRVAPGAEGMTYLVNRELHDQKSFDRLLFQDSRVAINHIANDDHDWANDPDSHFNPRYIDESIAHYLDRIGAGPVLRSMLKSFFWSEYGQEIEDLNLFVLFDYLDIDMDSPHFRLIPNVDEAFTVPGGAEQITDALEAAVHAEVRLGRRVGEITDDGHHITLRATLPDDRVETLTARHVIFAAPLHSLKHVRVDVEGVSQHAVEHAAAATYASGAKIHLKFAAGFADFYQYPGIILTDTGEQIWPSSTGQGAAGLLTVLTGPLPPGWGATEDAALKVMKALDDVMPGLAKFYVGAERSDAPLSYSGSLRPGERARLAIHNGGPRFMTAGEASSRELQGYLEGALRSADDAVSRLIMARYAKRKRGT